MVTADELASFPSLAALDSDGRHILAGTGREMSFPAGYRVIREGTPADRCWLIRGGRVQLAATVAGRGDIVLQTLHGGDLLGWSWLVPPYRWHFGAMTLEAVAAVEFDAATLTGLADADPRFGRELMRVFFEALFIRLQATRARLADLYRDPAAPAGFDQVSDAAGGGR
ncbi:Crp/Fnr family transcriptional regulator [Nocardia sp. NPDC003345]